MKYAASFIVLLAFMFLNLYICFLYDRKNKIEKTLAHVNNNWIILLTVNDGFFDIFQNWFHFFCQLKLTTKLILIAEDDVVYSKLQQIAGNTIVERNGRLSSAVDAVYGTKTFYRIVSGRPTYILKYLKEGYNVLYTDVDTVWLKNPFPCLNGTFDIAMPKYDIEYCTGFMAVKNTIASKNLMKAWKTSLKGNLTIIQTAFKEVFQEKSDIRLKELNPDKFPHGSMYFKTFTSEQRQNVVVAHNNRILSHTRKLERFKQHKLWFSSKASIKF